MQHILRRTGFLPFLAAAILLQLSAVSLLQSPAQGESLPGGVTFRLNKIDQHMTNVEKYLAENRANHNELERAQGVLEEIKTGYPANASAPEVLAAEARINKGAAAIEKLEADKASAKQAQADAEKSEEQKLEAWADRLSVYKADEREGSKGNFGVPLSDPAKITALAPQYREAKALYEEFLATGINKDDHWKLRQAEWDIRVAIENYESSIVRLTEEAGNEVKTTKDWLTQQKASSEPKYYPTDMLERIRQMVAGVNQILPADNEQLRALNADFAELQKLQSDIEKIVLQKRKMKPDAYKGSDAARIKELAKSIVLKEDKTTKILRAHIISTDWNTESAVEWTDTTKTAVQHRVTKGLNVQVAFKKGADCFLYTLFIHKDTVGGATGGLTGHIMHRDKFLEQNLPK